MKKFYIKRPVSALEIQQELEQLKGKVASLESVGVKPQVQQKRKGKPKTAVYSPLEEVAATTVTFDFDADTEF